MTDKIRNGLREEVLRLRAVLELVAGNLQAAEEKREDAPQSARSHTEAAMLAVSEHLPKDGTYSETAAKLRNWTAYGECFADNVRLRAEVAKMRALLVDVDRGYNMEHQVQCDTGVSPDKACSCGRDDLQRRINEVTT